MRVIVPSRYGDLLDTLLESMEQSQKYSTSAVVVADNGLTQTFRERWPRALYVQIEQPFVYAQAINRAAGMFGDDLFIIGDDSRIVSPWWQAWVESVFEDWPMEYGMLNVSERDVEHPELAREAVGALAFSGTLIPRRIWQQLGQLDARFTGYGYDDIDFCFRLHALGYKIGVTDFVRIEHRGTVSYERVFGTMQTVDMLRRQNHQVFKSKWGFDLSDDPFRPWDKWGEKI